jgi:hypothetical protein
MLIERFAVVQCAIEQSFLRVPIKSIYDLDESYVNYDEEYKANFKSKPFTCKIILIGNFYFSMKF